MDSLWLQRPSLRPARRWSSSACSFSSEKRRAQCGRSAFSAFWDASWEAHLGIASWGSLGESARDSKGGWGSHQGVYRSWQTIFLLAEIPASSQNLPMKKIPESDSFMGESYQTFKRVNAILIKILWKIKEDGMRPNSFCEACIIGTTRQIRTL